MEGVPSDGKRLDLADSVTTATAPLFATLDFTFRGILSKLSNRNSKKGLDVSLQRDESNLNRIEDYNNIKDGETIINKAGFRCKNRGSLFIFDRLLFLFFSKIQHHGNVVKCDELCVHVI